MYVGVVLWTAILHRTHSSTATLLIPRRAKERSMNQTSPARRDADIFTLSTPALRPGRKGEEPSHHFQ